MRDIGDGDGDDVPARIVRVGIGRGMNGVVVVLGIDRVDGDERQFPPILAAAGARRAGGMGLISGRKAFQRPMKEGAGLLNAIQDVYLAKAVTVA